jgi:hypothetical protein
LQFPYLIIFTINVLFILFAIFDAPLRSFCFFCNPQNWNWRLIRDSFYFPLSYKFVNNH